MPVFDRLEQKVDVPLAASYASCRLFHGQRCVIRVFLCRVWYAPFIQSLIHSQPTVYPMLTLAYYFEPRPPASLF